MSKPLRAFFVACKPPYPKVGERLVLKDNLIEEGLDYKYADWGTDFSEEIRLMIERYKLVGHFNDKHYHPNAIVLTNERLTVKAIIPITQFRNMKEELEK